MDPYSMIPQAWLDALERVDDGSTTSSPPRRHHPGAHGSPDVLNDLAAFFVERYRAGGEPVLLGGAINLSRRALELLPSDHPDRPTYLGNLAGMFFFRYTEQGGARSDLSEAVELDRTALSLQPPGNLDRSDTLTNLGTTILTLYMQSGAQSDLLEAFQLQQEALTLRPSGHPDRAVSLNNLASVLRQRYGLNGAEIDLLKSIELCKEALVLRQPGHPDRPSSLTSLAVVIFMRYERDGMRLDLSNAIRLHREALDLFSPVHPSRLGALHNLAHVILAQYRLDGKKSDVSEAIMLYRKVINMQRPGNPYLSLSLNGLARAILMRYEREGAQSDLSEGVELCGKVIALRPRGHPNHPDSLTSFAAAILSRYRRNGAQSDLSEGIEMLREALDLFPPGHPDASNTINHLAGAIRARYELDGREPDLSEAIKLHKEALALQPSGNIARPDSLHNLAVAFLDRYGRNGAMPDLSEAIELLREALLLHVPGHPHGSNSLNSLAGAIIRRYERDGGKPDLSAGIKLHKEALALRPAGHRSRSNTLFQLATIYHHKYRKNGAISKFVMAVRYQKEALDTLPAEHPSWSIIAATLAVYMFEFSNLAGLFAKDADDAPTAHIILLLRNATAAKTSSIHDRLQGALYWIDIAAEIEPTSVLEAYRTAFTLLGSALALSRSLQDMHSNLLPDNGLPQGAKDLALRAALWALDSSPADSKLAVEFLDRGRNLLLGSVGQFRADLSAVRQQDPTLAKEFYRISRLLDSAITTGQDILEGKSSYEDQTNRFKRISAEWQAVIDRIRLLPNCESFLLPVPYIQLQEAATAGPVIVVVVGEKRSSAIIVMSKGDPHTLDLPEASAEALKTLYMEMEHASETRAPSSMRNILSDLWTMLVQPIIQELKDVLLIPTGSRIWWYPTSWASFLPLHAAGSYRRSGLNAPSFYISSYTPTLQALRRSRSRMSASSDETTGPLIVAQPQTPGQIELPSVNDEVEVVRKLASNTFLLSGEQGTKEIVLKELRNHSSIHLACHGLPDPSDPFKSHFVLHDGPLSLQDIITNDLPSADFAYLSACHSAAPDQTLPDEGLTLAGGMQFAGFKSVVGTLWEMADEDAPTLAKVFYEGLAKRSGEGKAFDCTKTAESLHDAVMELRQQKVPLLRWVNLVHYGI